MKLSDYIESLQYLLEKDGDMDCVVWTENEDFDSTEEGWYSTATKRDIDSSVFDKVSVACSYVDLSNKKQFCSTNMIGYVECQKEKVFVIKDLIR